MSSSIWVVAPRSRSPLRKTRTTCATSISTSPVAVRVTPPAERALRSGHPWLFDEAIISQSRAGTAGDVAVVFDRKDRFLAVGLLDPESLIRVRILAVESPERVGEGLFRDRIQRALDRRGKLVQSTDTTGLRILNGEGDGMPGVVCDRYAETLVVKLYSAAWIRWMDELTSALFTETAALGPERLVVLTSRATAEHTDCPPAWREGKVLEGPPLPDAVAFLESGLHFEAHPTLGHKTGFYLDQRENRRRLEGLTEGADVLNLFSYSGGFSAYAARGGARAVTSVDQAGPALEQAQRHFELNRHDPAIDEAVHQTIEGDAFAALDELADSGTHFDVVVVDPPSFTREAAHVEAAMRAYSRLTHGALRVLRPGGLLVQASCSSRVSAEDFFARIHREARAHGRPLREEARTEHPSDHPPGIPEGHYLKCLWARAE